MQGIDIRDFVLDIDLDCHVCDTCLNNRVPVLSNDLMQGIVYLNFTPRILK